MEYVVLGIAGAALILASIALFVADDLREKLNAHKRRAHGDGLMEGWDKRFFRHGSLDSDRIREQLDQVARDHQLLAAAHRHHGETAVSRHGKEITVSEHYTHRKGDR